VVVAAGMIAVERRIGREITHVVKMMNNNQKSLTMRQQQFR